MNPQHKIRWLIFSGLFLVFAIFAFNFFDTDLLRSDAEIAQGPSLKSFVQPPVLIGATTSKYKNAWHSEIIKNEFNSQGFNVPMSIYQPTPGRYDWQQIENHVRFARQAGITPIMHSVIYHPPGWTSSLTDKELELNLKKTVEAVMKKYKGKVDTYLLVNEAFNICGGFQLRDWSRIGEDPDEYIKLAFRWAKAVNPNAKLIIHDNNIEAKTCRADTMYNWMVKAKQEGVPIDGLGIQAHLLSTNLPNVQSFRDNIKRFQDVGFEVYITEFDVWFPTTDGFSEAERQQQGEIYETYIRAALESGVKSINFWSLRDGEDPWIYVQGYGKPKLYDENGNKKPAYFGVQRALQ